MLIRVLEKDYEPAKFPHADIVKKLTDISNNNKLSRHFHRDPMTVCTGCHHYSPIESTGQFPRCSTCHTQSTEHRGGDAPGLLGAYHRQCLGCHKEMKIKPLDCTGCHAEKTRVQAESRKN
ncbi:MAG: cytochrome c3 family protein [Thermodesulfobacteriota bacterium]|nr:cytochrome c3 family protein [Thermodesulfobacteriota bacterium]